MLYSRRLRQLFGGISAGRRVWIPLCTRVGGCVEPNPRAARPRAARARSGHSPAAGEIQEKVRGRHQSRQRAERRPSAARRPGIPDLVLQSSEQEPQAARRRRGRDDRVGQPPRGDVAVGRLLAAARPVPPVRARGLGRQRAASVRRPADSRWPRSGPTTRSAIRFGSRSCSRHQTSARAERRRRSPRRPPLRAPLRRAAAPRAPAPARAAPSAGGCGRRVASPRLPRRPRPRPPAAARRRPPRSPRPAPPEHRSAGRPPCRSCASFATSAGTRPRT